VARGVGRQKGTKPLLSGAGELLFGYQFAFRNFRRLSLIRAGAYAGTYCIGICEFEAANIVSSHISTCPDSPLGFPAAFDVFHGFARKRGPGRHCVLFHVICFISEKIFQPDLLGYSLPAAGSRSGRSQGWQRSLPPYTICSSALLLLREVPRHPFKGIF
jgi:hypothetical protein